MSKFFIESLSFGVAEGGMSCGGWVPGPKIIEIKVKQSDGNAFYLSHAIVDGMPLYFQTQNSSFELQITQSDDQEAWDELNKCLIIEAMSYEEAFEDAGEILPLLKLLGRIAESNKFDTEYPKTIEINNDVEKFDVFSIID